MSKKNYEIFLKLSNGNEIKSRVEARNQADALRRLQKSPEVVRFVGEAEIISVDIKPYERKPIDNKRFTLTTIDNKEGWYIAVDLDNRIKIEFKAHQYNKTNHIVKFGDGGVADALEEATAVRELADWLLQNFKDILE